MDMSHPEAIGADVAARGRVDLDVEGKS